MSRKHFRSIAATLLIIKEGMPKRRHALLCGALADTLAETNPRFNRAKFLAACGVEG